MTHPSFLHSTSMIRAGKFISRTSPVSSCIWPQNKTNKFSNSNVQLGKHFSIWKNSCSKQVVATAEKQRPTAMKPVARVMERNPIVKFIKGIQKVSHFKVSKAELSQAAYFTYEDLVEMIPIEQFFIEFQMPDTFASWFTIVELHLWIISARLMKEETIGYYARDMLTEAFFRDVVHRSALLGPRASLYRQKQVSILGYQFTAAYYGYDEGVQSSDKVLAAIVWRRFFGFECDDARQIERIVKYIRIQLNHLCYLTFDDIMFQRQDLLIPLSKVPIE